VEPAQPEHRAVPAARLAAAPDQSPGGHGLNGLGLGILEAMKTLILFVGWCLLFAVSWPIALIALVLMPLVWLLSLPLRLVGIAVGGVFALLKAIVMLPARLLGHR
jgi:hypothetical protein